MAATLCAFPGNNEPPSGSKVLSLVPRTRPDQALRPVSCGRSMLRIQPVNSPDLNDEPDPHDPSQESLPRRAMRWHRPCHLLRGFQPGVGPDRRPRSRGRHGRWVTRAAHRAIHDLGKCHHRPQRTDHPPGLHERPGNQLLAEGHGRRSSSPGPDRRCPTHPWRPGDGHEPANGSVCAERRRHGGLYRAHRFKPLPLSCPHRHGPSGGASLQCRVPHQQLEGRRPWDGLLPFRRLARVGPSGGGPAVHDRQGHQFVVGTGERARGSLQEVYVQAIATNGSRSKIVTARVQRTK